jgi:Ser/Thr protein kinase RdoA (MazF antagonist)
LDGASSAALHRLDLHDGSRVVVRRYVWHGYVEAEPDAPGREVDAVSYAASHGLAVPEVSACDLQGHEVGDGIPVILMTYLPGRPVAVPDLEALAEAAAAVHAVDPDGFGHEFLPWYEDEMVTPPPLTTRPALWEQAIDVWMRALPPNRPAFIHRDFHPGNVLWSQRRLSGIVDWASACRGPIGCDIAHCRANLRYLADPMTADRFVRTYTSLTGIELDPFWVVAGHLEPAPLVARPNAGSRHPTFRSVVPAR